MTNPSEGAPAGEGGEAGRPPTGPLEDAEAGQPPTGPPEADGALHPPSGPLEGETSPLHPAALGVWLGRSLVSLVIFVVVAGMVPAVGFAVLGFLLLSIGVRYLRFRWRLEPDAVVIEEGLLVRKRRVIPRDRVQTVDLKRGLVHRALGVVEVRIEAMGGSETEAALAAVEPAVAERLRELLLGRPRPWDAPGAGETAEAREPVEAEDVWARVAPGALVMAGLTGGRVGVVAAGLGFLSQVAPEAWWTGFMEQAVGRVPDPTAAEGLQVLLVLGFLAFLVAFVLSVAATVIAHWDFTLAGEGGTLAVRRGLVTQHRDTVPLHRIQAVRVEENLVRRLLGLGAVRAVVAGRAGAGGNEAGGLLLPVGRRAEVYRLARRAAGVGGEAPPELVAMPPRARKRRLARAVAGAGLAGIAAAIVASARGDAALWAAAGVAFLACLPPVWLLAEGAFRGLGWADHGGYLVVREGVLNRRTTFIPMDRLQVIETRANPFQQWAGLASLYLRVARPVLESPPRALDLEGELAERWREELAGRLAPGAASHVFGPGSPSG